MKFLLVPRSGLIKYLYRPQWKETALDVLYVKLRNKTKIIRTNKTLNSTSVFYLLLIK